MKQTVHCKWKGIGMCQFPKAALFKSLSIIFFTLIVSCEQAPAEMKLINEFTPYCECTDEIKGEVIQLLTPDQREVENIKKIIEVQGISIRPFKLCKADNIPGNIAGYATTINDFPYIIYDGSYLNAYSSNWRSIFLLAHEVGHHAHFHVSENSTHRHNQELEADRYAGFILYKLGATLQESIDMKSEEKPATDLHPDGRKRRRAIKEGWMAAAGLDPDQPTAFVPTITAPPRQSKSNIGGEWYETIIFGNREIMAEDMNYRIGGAICFDGKRRCRGLLYTIEDARKACRAIGWELMTNRDFKAIINYYAASADDENKMGDQEFDAVRAFGTLLTKGTSRFNARLGGYGLYYSGEIFFYENGVRGSYWISDLNISHMEPRYYEFDISKGTLVRYRTGKKTMLHSCRCAREINNH